MYKRQVLVSVTLLGESMTAMQVIGGALILGLSLIHIYLGVPVTASAVLAPLFYLLSLRFALNCAVVYALGLFLLGVLYITPLHVKKPQLRGVAFLSVFGLGEFAVLLRVLTR